MISFRSKYIRKKLNCSDCYYIISVHSYKHFFKKYARKHDINGKTRLVVYARCSNRYLFLCSSKQNISIFFDQAVREVHKGETFFEVEPRISVVQ